MAIINELDLGVSGLVLDEHKNPILNAKIVVEHREDKAVYTSNKGDFFRPLMPGKYHLEVSAPGRMDIVHEVVVPPEGRVKVDLWLETFEMELATTQEPLVDDLGVTGLATTTGEPVTEEPEQITEKPDITEKVVTDKPTTEKVTTEKVTTEKITTTEKALTTTTKVELREAENVNDILNLDDDDSLIKSDNLGNFKMI